MFRDMRRRDRDLGDAEARRIIARGTHGVLCVQGAEGYPYGVPMCYVSDGERILMHISSREGLLRESIGDGCRCSFTVTEHVGGMRFNSAIAFGTVREEPGMRREVLESMVDKYVPGPGRAGARSGIPSAMGSVTAIAVVMEHVSGKTVDRPEGR